jgi:hypothetical protein
VTRAVRGFAPPMHPDARDNYLDAHRRDALLPMCPEWTQSIEALHHVTSQRDRLRTRCAAQSDQIKQLAAPDVEDRLRPCHLSRAPIALLTKSRPCGCLARSGGKPWNR